MRDPSANVVHSGDEIVYRPKDSEGRGLIGAVIVQRPDGMIRFKADMGQEFLAYPSEVRWPFEGEIW